MDMPRGTDPAAVATARGPDTQLSSHAQSQIPELQDLRNSQNDFIDCLIGSLKRLADAAKLVKCDSLTAVESGREPDPGASSSIMNPVLLTKSIIQCVLMHLERMPERSSGASERDSPPSASVPAQTVEESGLAVLGSEEQEETNSEADDNKENVLQPTNHNLVDRKYGDYYLYGEETAPSSCLTMDNVERIQMTPSSEEVKKEQKGKAKQDDAASTSSCTATNKNLIAIAIEYTEHPQKHDANHLDHQSLSDTAVRPFNKEQVPSSPRHEGPFTPQNKRSNKGKQTSLKADCKNDENHMVLQDNDLRLLNEYTDMVIFRRSISHLSSGGLRRMAQLLPAMNRLGRGDWINGEEFFASAMYHNGAPQLASWTALYQTQLEARREMGYFGDNADNMTGKARRNLPRFLVDM